MFEKYDGVRAFWNPVKRAFYTRTGTKFNIPEEIVIAMPVDLFLDGEFWYIFSIVVPFSFFQLFTVITISGLDGTDSKKRSS